MRACKTKTTTNKSKMTKNDCDGIMGKSKQVAICAPSCSAVQFGVQDKPWTGVAGAFVEQKLKVSKTGHTCITYRNFFFLVQQTNEDLKQNKCMLSISLEPPHLLTYYNLPYSGNPTSVLP